MINLGWRSFFESQLRDDDAALLRARIVAMHRQRAQLLGDDIDAAAPLAGNAAMLQLTVGDWVLVDPTGPRIVRRLDRFALFQRRGAGTSGRIQPIAANVDTLFIVTSANRDFNVARLERYLAIAHDAGAHPVVVITKSDLADSVSDQVKQASQLSPGLLVEALDARDPAQVAVLQGWCGPGQTVALVGSSGVGKSTLINTLTGSALATSAVREDDQRGRHTTTGRSMHQLPGGGWLIDTPGMRELQLVDVADAIEDVFAEVAELAHGCRFADCTHTGEPGCAVLAAIDAGKLDAGRLQRYHKLQREDRHNTATLAERRARDKRFGKMVKTVMAEKQQEKGNK